jgi:hypothetical protein
MHPLFLITAASSPPHHNSFLSSSSHHPLLLIKTASSPSHHNRIPSFYSKLTIFATERDHTYKMDLNRQSLHYSLHIKYLQSGIKIELEFLNIGEQLTWRGPA